MRIFTLTLTIVSAFCAAIYAGPEPLPSGKETKEVVQPVAPACPSWTGFYIGGFGGYKFAATDIDLKLGGDWDLIPNERDALEAAASRDLNTSGAEAGGLIGFNYQFGNWVVGAEADGGYLWLRDSRDSEAGIINDYSVRTSLKTHYLATFGPRIGYALCRWLPYVTGGLALGDLDFHQSFFIVGTDVGQGGSQDETQVGWMVGGGLEYALTNHWRLRGQYQYVDLGSVDFNTVFTNAPTFTGNHEASLREHNVSFALMFNF
jgi:outer membrane immunogenic protein